MATKNYRIEKDSLGEVKVPKKALWGAQTQRAVDNFPISGIKMDFPFTKSFITSLGLIKDAAGYHRALAIAMNPDKFARFFYEQGKSNATEDVMRKTKNIEMSERRAPEVTNKGGFQVKSVNPDTGRGLKIRSIKRK